MHASFADSKLNLNHNNNIFYQNTMSTVIINIDNIQKELYTFGQAIYVYNENPNEFEFLLQ